MAHKTIMPLNNSEISAFCGQMAMILHAGISPSEGLSLMEEDAKNADEKYLIHSMNKTLIKTGSLYQATLAAKVFPIYMLEMVNLGEQTGKLDEIFSGLARHYEREASILSAVRSAIIYPFIMIMMMLCVLFILMTKVMPVFAQVFSQLGSEMTGLSRGVLDFGNMLNRYAYVLFIIIFIFVVLLIYFSATKLGRRQFSSLTAHFALTRAFERNMSACRFASGMAMTLGSGMTQEEALLYAKKLVVSARFNKMLDACMKSMEGGASLTDALDSSGIFSGVYSRMAMIGNRTGNLEDTMLEIADNMQEELDNHLAAFIGAIEPTLVIILSIAVGMILLSVMLPLTAIMANL